MELPVELQQLSEQLNDAMHELSDALEKLQRVKLSPIDAGRKLRLEKLIEDLKIVYAKSADLATQVSSFYE